MRILPALALSAALLTGACQNPDGSVNLPATIALGAGVGLAAALIANSDDKPRHHHRGYGHRGYRGYERGYGYAGHGYGYPRRW